MIEDRKNMPDINILLIEDNSADVFLTRESLSESVMYSYKVFAINNGIDALAFLRRGNGYENADRPHLILLDLSLPKMDGFEILEEIRTDETLTDVPVFVLTTAMVPGYVKRAEELEAGGYLLKPIDLEAFETLLSRTDITFRQKAFRMHSEE